jgi:hypothetical protein
MSGADKPPSEQPDLPIKSATTDRRPGGTTGRSGRGVHSRSRQTTCRGVNSGGECTPSTTRVRYSGVSVAPRSVPTCGLRLDGPVGPRLV